MINLLSVGKASVCAREHMQEAIYFHALIVAV
jgi:hypothetical protein